MNYDFSHEFSRSADRNDPLRSFRDRFIIPADEEGALIYFLGNSLGLQPKTARDYAGKILDQWAGRGVESFFSGDEPWMDYHDRLLRPLTRITGAMPHELAVMNQLTVNLHLMLVSFYAPAGRRNKILIEAKAFPSDQYALESHLAYRGLQPEKTLIEINPRANEVHLRIEDVVDMIRKQADEIALILLGGVNYYTGQVMDMKTIAEAAHECGLIIGFDLAHAIGNIPLYLHDWGVDFACWCNYKYLNSGPGAVGGVFIHEKHHQDSRNRFAGWWGYQKETRFNMEKGFIPMAGAQGWQLSTPAIMLYALHRSSLEILEEAGWENILQKGNTLTGYLWFLLEEIIQPFHEDLIRIITPAHEAARGCQVSILVKHQGRKIFDGLMEAGILVDWREPDVIRLAPVPLYNTYEEVWTFANVFKRLLHQYLD